MKFFCASLLLCSFATRLVAENPAPISLSEPQQKFARELATVFQTLENKNAAAGAGADGWLFFAGELRLLSLSRFWGNDAPKVSRAHKPELADPIPAIVDFQQQLKARGIDLLVVFFFFKQKTAYEIGLGIPAEPLFRSRVVTQLGKLD